MSEMNQELENEIEEVNDTEESDALEFDVSMTAKLLYDFQIYNSYHKSSSGIVGSCIGALGLVLGINRNSAICIILGIIIILYTPISLKMRCAQTMQLSETFKKPLHYIINAEGIHVSQGDVESHVEWKDTVRAVSTRQSIIVYTGKRNASIFPRKQLKDKLPWLIGSLSRYMEPNRVRIKY